ncbi:MAG: dephospho-CoA kinase, partial [Chthoniobacterales bacterium]
TTQLDRLRARGIDADTAKAMLASQLPIGQKVARANFVICNDGSLAALGRQTKLVANQLFHD